jgi:PilZ domain
MSESVSERRRSARQRRLNGAKIIFNNNSSVIDCVLRDLSDKGARLRVASPTGIPDMFDLRIDRNGARHPSKVVWRSADSIGVIFCDCSTRTGARPASLGTNKEQTR